MSEKWFGGLFTQILIDIQQEAISERPLAKKIRYRQIGVSRRKSIGAKGFLVDSAEGRLLNR